MLDCSTLDAVSQLVRAWTFRLKALRGTPIVMGKRAAYQQAYDSLVPLLDIEKKVCHIYFDINPIAACPLVNLAVCNYIYNLQIKTSASFLF